jgi:hypothetical protein
MEASSPTPGGAGLDNCACKRGFFTLRDCENPAAATCDICSRRVCSKHLAPRVGATVCVECAAKQEEEGVVTPAGGKPSGKQPADQPMETEEDVTYQAARYRSRYYRSYGYEPMWWGSYDPYWSGYGYRWYDDPYDDDDDGGGFGDS